MARRQLKCFRFCSPADVRSYEHSLYIGSFCRTITLLRLSYTLFQHSALVRGFCCLVFHRSTILLFPPPSEPRGHPCASISGGWVAGKACVLQPVIEGSFSRTTNGDKSCVTTGLPNHETTNRCLSSAIPPLFGLNQVNSQFWRWFPKLPSAIKCDSFRWR
ncbi:hypothetical protein M747DRAFT_44997 [Aspergillus niger ATCC 13496]|uniref:Uncharacterized protein n=1 Tax=Aspergillus niger ATCC 13496 TaxID=1353008 RepID=A0A370BZZ3_ASPNG|nr:hypothetical protein M747DRAFT_44997 [Aspergillus niger ATCC 13496]